MDNTVTVCNGRKKSYHRKFYMPPSPKPKKDKKKKKMKRQKKAYVNQVIKYNKVTTMRI